MFVWIGLSADQEFVQQVFGVPSAVQVNIEMTRFPELDNPLNQAVRTVVEKIRSQHHRSMRVSICKQAVQNLCYFTKKCVSDKKKFYRKLKSKQFFFGHFNFVISFINHTNMFSF